MAVFTWDHVHLRSLDPDAAGTFYADTFDGRIVSRVDTPASYRVTVEIAGHLLFIERAPEGTHAAPEPPYVGIEHLGLTVPNLREVVADLEARGVEVVVAPNSPRPGLTVAFLRGPDNVRIELLQRDSA